MSELSQLSVCKSLLERFPSAMKERLISLLPRKEQGELQNLEDPAPLTKEWLNWDLLSHTHSTWLAPYLRTLSEGDIRLFLAALKKEQAHTLTHTLGLQNDLPSLTKVGRKTVRRYLLQQLTENQDVIPPAFFPDRPLHQLLLLPPTILEKTIHCLGLHDLSFAMRQIISTATLKKIYSSLPKKEGDYLKSLLLHREPITLSGTFLNNWDGSREGLRKLVEARGIHRLAHALHTYHPSIKWLIARMLDMRLGTQLLSIEGAPTHTRAEKILTGQVEKILTFLREKENA